MNLKKNISSKARQAFQELKQEIAEELGVSGKEHLSVDTLTTNENKNSYTGGEVQKKYIKMTEDQISK
ncbi:small, acid-soluble spore protein, alpha/beta type [Clostridiaceae bacterium 35-E11]